MINNFTDVKPLRYWVQHILPLVYDDSLSYMELLGKVINTLNEVVKNNNMLPDYIMKLIKEYISSGEIEKVLAEVLANYMLNVKFPPAGLKPATGDGSADDTEAIQGCIDYAYNNGGMSVYFPSGSYLTQPLTLRDKATLFGQDRYTTRLVMKGGATTAMFTGDVNELTLTGLGFDGNMDIQVNNVNLFTISVNSAIITNCLLTDGYELLNVTVNDNLQLNDVIFKHAVENALVLKGAGVVQGNNLIFKSISALVGKNFVVMDVSKSILEQLKCYGASPNAVLINGSNNVVKMWNEQSLKAYTDNGANNTVEVYTQSEQKKLTGSKTTDISGDLTEIVAGNCTKTVTGDISESANNFKMTIQLACELTANRLTEQLTNKEVNATNSTENLGNKTEAITGEKEVNANGLTENIANEKHVIAGSVTEDITGDKHVNAANSIETVQGDKTVTAGDISETAVNKTVHITKDSTEQVDGTRALTVAGANNETTGARTETVNGNKYENVTGISTETITGDKHVNATNSIETLTGDKTINATDLILNPTNPITYKAPIDTGLKFSTIPFKDNNNNPYDVLVKNDKTYLYSDVEWINVAEKGCDITGTNDCSLLLNSFITNGAVLYFPKGTYKINSPIRIQGTTVGYKVKFILDPLAEIIAGATMDFMIGISTIVPPIIADVSKLYDFTIEGGKLNANKMAQNGIVLLQYHHSLIKDLSIFNTIRSGIDTYYHESGTGGLGAGLEVTNVLIWGDGSSYGIYNGRADNTFTNVTCVDCIIGFYSPSTSHFNKCTAWISKSIYYDNSICFKTDSGAFFTDCTVDTMKIGFDFINPYSGGFIINLNVTHNSNVIAITALNKPTLFNFVDNNGVYNGRVVVSNLLVNYNFNYNFTNATYLPNSIFIGLKTPNYSTPVNYPYNPYTVNSKLTCTKVGEIAYINLSFDEAMAFTAYQEISIGTVPLKPRFETVTQISAYESSTNIVKSLQLKIKTTGEVTLTNNTNLAFTVYVVDGTLMFLSNNI